MGRQLQRGAFYVVLAIAVAANVDESRAADGDYLTLDGACKDMAAQIDKALVDLKISGPIMVQSFTDSSGFPNAQIRRLLSAALETKGYRIQSDSAAAYVRGTLFVNKTSLVIESDLIKAGEGRVQTWRHRLESLEPAVQGTTFEVASNPTASSAQIRAPGGTYGANAGSVPGYSVHAGSVVQKEKIYAALMQCAIKPKCFLTNDDTVVRPTAESKFGLSILTFKDGQAVRLPLTISDGFALVDLAPGQEFSVAVVNETKTDVAVHLAVDAVNMFALSEVPEYRREGRIWIGTRGGEINGWYINDQTNRKFRRGTGPSGESFSVDDDLGGVTVAICPPPNSTVATRGVAAIMKAPKPDAGISEGSVVPSNFVVKEGHIGGLTAVITIRYKPKSSTP